KASDYGRFNRDTMEGPFYNDIFPDVKVRGDVRSAEDFQTTAGGAVISAGVGGTITGRGADIFLIDDPLKDAEEAASEVIKDKIWDWYGSVARTRLSPGGIIMVVQTRWATDDLCGRLLEREGTIDSGGIWDVLKLPAILNGEALWPEKFPLDDLLEIRNLMGEKMFQALYQQEPMDITERIFADPQFGEPPVDLRKIAYLDPAFGGKDYSALAIGGNHRVDDNPRNDKAYVTHGSIWKGTIDVTYNRVEKILKAQNVEALWIESNQAQTVLSFEFRKRGIKVNEVSNNAPKHLRIQNYVKLNWPRIYFSKLIENDFIQQVLKYSELARNDDAPDALAGLMQQLSVGRTPFHERYSGVGSLMSRIFRR
ncbi:MAG: terminase, partial [Leptospiraceae bacterium]|nr:terminase [Leptospiraceae bacterium]